MVARSGSAYPDRVQVLWWLVPTFVTTSIAMVWVSRTGRDHVVDPELQVAKLAKAMESARPQTYAVRSKPAQRSTGVARRRSL